MKQRRAKKADPERSVIAVRNRLQELIDTGEYPTFDEMSEMVYNLRRRKSHLPIAKVSRNTMTARIRDAIKIDLTERPKPPNYVIGLRYNVDGGRVSETSKGEWDHLSYDTSGELE